MSTPSLTYSIEPRLASHVKELDFDIESYKYGLRVMGVPEEWVDGHSVTFAYSEEPYSKGFTQWLTDSYSLGHYYPFKKEITLFPRTIAHSIRPGGWRRDHGGSPSQLSSVLSRATNQVLMHESGHLADYSHTDLLSEVAYSDHHREAAAKFLTKTGMAALVGSVAGSELAEFTDLQPAAGSLLGLVVVGGVAGVVGLRKAAEQVKAHAQFVDQKEAAAEAFAEDFAVQALLGNVVQIELKK